MKSAAAKVSVFAYDRETREPIWQSGIAQAGSSARDTWILGVGPLQYGTIYGGTRFAGKRIKQQAGGAARSEVAIHPNGVDHRGGFLFANRIFGRKLEEQPKTDGASGPPPTMTATTDTVQLARPRLKKSRTGCLDCRQRKVKVQCLQILMLRNKSAKGMRKFSSVMKAGLCAETVKGVS